MSSQTLNIQRANAMRSNLITFQYLEHSETQNITYRHVPYTHQ